MNMLRLFDLALRIATAAWPLLTELLALAFWSSNLLPTGLIQALVVIGSLCALVFTPITGSLARVSYVAVVVLLVHSAWSLGVQGGSQSGIQAGALVNAGFALTWLVYLILRARHSRTIAALP
ncbi:MAG: hypothetical protein ACK50I_20210 [Burkholderiales bacterium]|nr:hypothetical protein [Acidobacteriaceae bacterium]MCZ8108970.1 hypothetical protein [Burkholderiales bacterium]